MIYEKDLDESIAKYQGEINPSIETCRKLAACLIVKRELFGQTEQLMPPGQSFAYAEGPAEKAILYESGTDFAKAINGRDPDEIWPWVDELMSTLQILQPKLYDNAMRQLR